MLGGKVLNNLIVFLSKDINNKGTILVLKFEQYNNCFQFLPNINLKKKLNKCFTKFGT